MSNFMNNMERKFGKYAIPNLTFYIIGLFVTGYLIQLMSLTGLKLTGFLTLDPYRILHYGEVWRLVSWLLIPPQRLSIFTIITLFFYFFVGSSMERTIGTFRYNVFIFGGFLLMILAAFTTYGVYALVLADKSYLELYMMGLSPTFYTYYIQEAVFLIFAICYPEVQILLYMIIPVKVKYLGIFYAAFLGFQAIYDGLIGGNYAVLFAIVFQFINVVIFYIQTGKLHHIKPGEAKRRENFKKNVKMTPKGITRHKCAVCGRSEEDDPNLEFRFCSKCNGNYEYCQDHLFTHQHIK